MTGHHCLVYNEVFLIGRTCTEYAEVKTGGVSNAPEVKRVASDVGGAYVGPTQDRVLRVLKELELETFRVYEGY